MMTAEWGGQLIGAWNASGWMDIPGRIGDRIARLIGAPQGTVVMGDTLSIKVYQAIASALALRPDRRVILSDSGNFPTDLYMVHGLIGTLGRHELKIVAPEERVVNGKAAYSVSRPEPDRQQTAPKLSTACRSDARLGSEIST
jgi:kynureninase